VTAGKKEKKIRNLRTQQRYCNCNAKCSEADQLHELASSLTVDLIHPGDMRPVPPGEIQQMPSDDIDQTQMALTLLRSARPLASVLKAMHARSIGVN
jgi:hypothetical protein